MCGTRGRKVLSPSDPHQSFDEGPEAGHGPNSERLSSMERVPVEVWQQILLKAMEVDKEAPTFATSCTPYTFLHFVKQQTQIHSHQRPHRDYLKQRRRLQLVCRAWNEFVLFTSHRWLQLEDESPMYQLDSTILGARGIGPVERLCITIHSVELMTPILFWASHILKRPANQSPLRAYNLRLLKTSRLEYNPWDDLVGRTRPECSTNTNTNTNTTLRCLSITVTNNTDAPVEPRQILCTFPGLRALFLVGVGMTPRQTISLPVLEVLYLHQTWDPLQWAMADAWDTPALRHVHLSYFNTTAQLVGVLDGFLGRYAGQLESLELFELANSPVSYMQLPPAFWEQFPALRLLGFMAVTLQREDWSGWSVVPPSTHPLRYLVCWSHASAECTVDRVRPRWTWHDGVRLVAGRSDTYYVVKNVRDDQWIAKMEETRGVLPEV